MQRRYDLRYLFVQSAGAASDVMLMQSVHWRKLC